MKQGSWHESDDGRRVAPVGKALSRISGDGVRQRGVALWVRWGGLSAKTSARGKRCLCLRPAAAIGKASSWRKALSGVIVDVAGVICFSAVPW